MKFLRLAEVNLQAETQSMNCIKCLRVKHSKNIWFLDGHTFLEFILGIDWVNKSLASESAGQGTAVGPGHDPPAHTTATARGTKVLQGLGKWNQRLAPFGTLWFSFLGLGEGGDDTGALVSVSCVQWCFQLIASVWWEVMQSLEVCSGGNVWSGCV